MSYLLHVMSPNTFAQIRGTENMKEKIAEQHLQPIESVALTNRFNILGTTKTQGELLSQPLWASFMDYQIATRAAFHRERRDFNSQLTSCVEAKNSLQEAIREFESTIIHQTETQQQQQQQQSQKQEQHTTHNNTHKQTT